jgi:zinc protease
MPERTKSSTFGDCLPKPRLNPANPSEPQQTQRTPANPANPANPSEPQQTQRTRKMVPFIREILPNGLRVLVHQDTSTPLVAVNVLYFVGSRDEQPDRTGFAHLFEHLMFAGSRNVPDFDEPLQRAGGENNAYTTNDYTTFYNILPVENLETALWLESDRMLALSITKRAFEVQRKVVIEEFKETCLNEPYGDSWHHLSDLMYHEHPYRWPVIGLSPEHLEHATIDDVRSFYRR